MSAASEGGPAQKRPRLEAPECELKAAQEKLEKAIEMGKSTELVRVLEKAVEDARKAVEDVRKAVEDARQAKAKAEEKLEKAQQELKKAMEEDKPTNLVKMLESAVEDAKQMRNYLLNQFDQTAREVLKILDTCEVKPAAEQYGKYLSDANLTLRDRGAALQILAEAAVCSAKATSNTPRQLVVFAGPSGIGKTRGGFEASVMWGREDAMAALPPEVRDSSVFRALRKADVLTLYVDLNNELPYHWYIDKRGPDVRLGARLAARAAGMELDALIHVPDEELLVDKVLEKILLRRLAGGDGQVLLVVHVDEWQLYMRSLMADQNVGEVHAVHVIKSMFSALNCFAFRPPPLLADRFILLPVLSGTPVLGGVKLELTERMARVNAPLSDLCEDSAHELAVELFKNRGLDEISVRKMLKTSVAARVALGDTGFWPRLLVQVCEEALQSAVENREQAQSQEPILRIKWAECAYAVSEKMRTNTKVPHEIVMLVLTGEPVEMTNGLVEATSGIALAVRDADLRGLVQLRPEEQTGLVRLTVPFMLLRLWCPDSMFPEDLLRPLAAEDAWTWEQFERLYAHFTAARLNALWQLGDELERVLSLRDVVKGGRGADVLLKSEVRIKGTRCVQWEANQFMKNLSDEPPRTQVVLAAPSPLGQQVMVKLDAGVFLAAKNNALFDMRYTLEGAGTQSEQASVHVFVQDKHTGTGGTVTKEDIGDWYTAADAATKNWREGAEKTVLVYFTNRRLISDFDDAFLNSRPRLLVVTRAELSDALTPALVARGLIPSNTRTV